MMKKFIVFSISLLLAGILTACGGSGGGGPSFTSLSYDGITDPATITDMNAADLSIAFLEGSAGSDENFLATQSSSNTFQNTLQHQAALKLLAEQTRKATLQALQSTTSNTPMAVSESIPGQCDGHPGSLNISDSSSQTDMNVTLTYNHFCIGNISPDPAYNWGYEFILHGQVHITGSYQVIGQNTAIIYTMTQDVAYMETTFNSDYNYDGLVDDSFSHEMSGVISIEFDGTTANNPVNITTSIYFTDATGTVYRIDNLQNDYFNGIMSGRLYHPDYGYVDVETIVPFMVYNNGSYEMYCDGTLKISEEVDPVTGDGNYAIFSAAFDCSTFSLAIYWNNGTPFNETDDILVTTVATDQIWP